jgi:chromosome segregation ATPase
MLFLAVFTLITALATGCSKEATIDNINEAKEDLLESLGLVNTKADETTEDIESAYSQLKSALDSKDLTDEAIKELEAHLESLESKYDTLKDALDSSEDNGNELFDMLMRRAEENQTYREKMVASIEKKKEKFDAKMDAAKEVMTKIEKSVQKYDDIVGFFQVNKGLEGIDSYILEAEQAIKSGNLLNEQIKGHISDGLNLVGAL